MEIPRMKTNLTKIVLVASVLALSGTAFAGENCPSKKGAHKDMSATLSNEAKDHHGWKMSQETAEADKSAAAVNTDGDETPAQSPAGALKI
jgi:hypothetical protein